MAASVWTCAACVNARAMHLHTNYVANYVLTGVLTGASHLCCFPDSNIVTRQYNIIYNIIYSLAMDDINPTLFMNRVELTLIIIKQRPEMLHHSITILLKNYILNWHNIYFPSQLHKLQCNL